MKKQNIIIISLVSLLFITLILIYYYRSLERPLINMSADGVAFWQSEEEDSEDFYTLTDEDVKKLNEVIKTTKVNPIVVNEYTSIMLLMLEFNLTDYEYYFILNEESADSFPNGETYHFEIGKNTSVLKVFDGSKWRYFKTQDSNFYNEVNEIAEPYIEKK